MVGQRLSLLLLLMAVAQSSAKTQLHCSRLQEELSVASGGTVVMPCSFNWTGVLPEDPRVAWQKTVEGASPLVVHQHERYVENKSQNREFTGRTSLVPSWFEKRDATLTLSRVSENDTGLYQCLIVSQQPYDMEVCANVQLTVSPGAADAMTVPSMLLFASLSLTPLCN